MRTSFTVTKIDTPDNTPIGERIRFKIEFMLLMLQVGRTDEAQSVYDQITDLLEEIDNA